VYQNPYIKGKVYLSTDISATPTVAGALSDSRVYSLFSAKLIYVVTLSKHRTKQKLTSHSTNQLQILQ
jgi:hypothetical protein